MCESRNRTIICSRAPDSGRGRRHPLAALRYEDGQALVEFALVLPLLLLAVVGIVSFGRAMNYDEQATHLVNEAARYAIVNQVPNGATGTLGQWLQSQAAADSLELAIGTGAVAGPPSVCLKFPNGTANVGDPVTVQMSFTFKWVPLLNVGPSTTITRSATMRIEVPPTAALFTATPICA
jgi:Flp pilus assembly protein TadG